jgi:hypothetical protein
MLDSFLFDRLLAKPFYCCYISFSAKRGSCKSEFSVKLQLGDGLLTIPVYSRYFNVNSNMSHASCLYEMIVLAGVIQSRKCIHC